MGSELIHRRRGAVLPPGPVVSGKRNLPAHAARLAQWRIARKAEIGNLTREGALAETRDGYTTFSPAVADHPRRVEIEAHEAVHRAQYVARGRRPYGSRAQLEAEAERGARVLNSGGRFEPRHAASAGHKLTFPPGTNKEAGTKQHDEMSFAERVLEKKGLSAEKMIVLAYAFSKGLYAGLSGNMTHADLVRLLISLIEAGDYIDKSPAEFLKGIDDGLQAEIDKLEKLIKKIPKLPKILLEVAPRVISFLVDGGAATFDITVAIGAALGKRYANSLKAAAVSGPEKLSYDLGRLLAPLLIEIVLTLIGLLVANVAGLIVARFRTVVVLVRRMPDAFEPLLDMIRKRLPTGKLSLVKRRAPKVTESMGGEFGPTPLRMKEQPLAGSQVGRRALDDALPDFQRFIEANPGYRKAGQCHVTANKAKEVFASRGVRGDVVTDHVKGHVYFKPDKDRRIVDPVLRDFLDINGKYVDDIPVNKMVYSELEHAELMKRLPKVKGTKAADVIPSQW